jgi:hypothetical protein
MLESLQKTWKETLEIPEARWIVWISILVVSLLVAFYVAKKFRDMATGGSFGSVDLLPDADKLRLEGKLDETEYKKLKSQIAEQQKQIVNKKNTEKD